MSSDGLWVISDVAPDGSYVVTVTAGADRAITLDAAAAVRYAATVAAVAQYAAHDAAVVAQLRATKLADELVGQVVGDLRNSRPRLDHAATEPLRFVPGVSVSTGEPFIEVRLDGKVDGQIDVGQATDHAANVLRGIAAAQSDTAYHQVLTLVGLDDARVRGLVGEVGRYYHPDRPS